MRYICSVANNLERYADLAIGVGLNLQSGQRLVIRSPIEAVELTRALVARAYDAGCPYVDVSYHDDELDLVRFRHAPDDSFEEFPAWRVRGMLERAEQGAAFLTVAGGSPDLLKEQDPERVATALRVASEQLQPFRRDYISTMRVSWCVIAAAVAPWAARVFPEAPGHEQVDRLWDAIFQACRVDRPDPREEWRRHIGALEARREHLNARAYTALRYAAPGTELTVGLPDGHVWKGAVDRNPQGTQFVPNIPTEEVFTMPHNRRVDGTVSATKPLNYGGPVDRGFEPDVRAGEGGQRPGGVGSRGAEEADRDRRRGRPPGRDRPGAAPLTHLQPRPAVLPHAVRRERLQPRRPRPSVRGLPARRRGDVGAAALRTRAPTPVPRTVDFMIGSDRMDIDGVLADGSTEPVMRAGEWAIPGRQP